MCIFLAYIHGCPSQEIGNSEDSAEGTDDVELSRATLEDDTSVAATVIEEFEHGLDVETVEGIELQGVEQLPQDANDVESGPDVVVELDDTTVATVIEEFEPEIDVENVEGLELEGVEQLSQDVNDVEAGRDVENGVFA
jgi:hypothetical protein